MIPSLRSTASVGGRALLPRVAQRLREGVEGAHDDRRRRRLLDPTFLRVDDTVERLLHGDVDLEVLQRAGRGDDLADDVAVAADARREQVQALLVLHHVDRRRRRAVGRFRRGRLRGRRGGGEKKSNGDSHTVLDERHRRAASRITRTIVTGSTGLVRWAAKPAARMRSRSSARAYAVSATAGDRKSTRLN